VRAFSSQNDSFLHLLIAFCAVLFFREKQLKKLKAGKERIDLKAKDQASKLADLKKSAKTLKKSNSALKGASKTKDVQVADLQDKIEKAQGRINTLEGRTGKFAPSALYDSRRELDFPKLSINKNTEGGRGQARRRT
jgi:septal ring factor EnvC (AmiA/AmiB activator)